MANFYLWTAFAAFLDAGVNEQPLALVASLFLIALGIVHEERKIRA